MSVQGSAARKLFNVELPDRVAELLRVVEGRIRAPVAEVRGGDAVDIAPTVGYFDENGKPAIAYEKKSGGPGVEELTIEIARLWLRNGKFERSMPYAEMRHPGNQRLCRRLYRAIEEEILLSECESRGVPVRKWLTAKLERGFVEPLGAGKYRSGEADPGRSREGAIDALEATIAEVDERAGRRLTMAVAEADPGIARTYGLVYKVIEQHRPFEGEDRVRAAYYLAVPFLFDARKASTPIMKTRPM